jgi:hypothetical protein
VHKERKEKDMKITELKIKENISPDIIAEAIEFISNACFVNGTYNPYYQSFAERMAIAQFFLDGIEFEDGDSLFVICELDDIKKLINKFYGDDRFSEQTKLMNIVKENVKEVVDYKKQRMIHGADAIELIAKRIDDFGKFINDLDVALGNLVNLDLSSMTAEDIANGRKLVEKMANGNAVQVLKEAANFDIDKASQEIIDAKNKQIEELNKRNAELEMKYNARNVLAFKKESDE